MPRKASKYAKKDRNHLSILINAIFGKNWKCKEFLWLTRIVRHVASSIAAF